MRKACKSAARSSLAAPPPIHWLGVPLKVNQHVFGALVLKSYSEPNVALRERDKEVLTLVAQQLAAAIDRKRNEQTLRRSEVRYRSLVQTAVYGIYRSSLEGRFLDVNPALIGMLGYNSALEVLALDPQKDVFRGSRANTPDWLTSSAAPGAWMVLRRAGSAKMAPHYRPHQRARRRERR